MLQLIRSPRRILHIIAAQLALTPNTPDAWPLPLLARLLLSSFSDGFALPPDDTSPTRPPLIPPTRDIGPFTTNVIPAEPLERNPLNPIDGGEASINFTCALRGHSHCFWLNAIHTFWVIDVSLHYTITFLAVLWSGSRRAPLQQPQMLSQSAGSNASIHLPVCPELLQCSFQTPLCFLQEHGEFLSAFRGKFHEKAYLLRLKEAIVTPLRTQDPRSCNMSSITFSFFHYL